MTGDFRNQRSSTTRRSNGKVIPTWTGGRACSDMILNQAFGVGIAIGLAVVGTFLILKVCDAVIGVRVDADAEEQGLDLTQHGEEGYILEA